MAQAKSKPRSKSRASRPKRPAAQRAANPADRRPVEKTSSEPAKANTKHARIIGMLSSAHGATVAAMMTATGWQQHSVRGFLAGVVRKRLKLELVSEQTDKGRIYRIKNKRMSAAKTEAPKAAA